MENSVGGVRGLTHPTLFSDVSTICQTPVQGSLQAGFWGFTFLGFRFFVFFGFFGVFWGFQGLEFGVADPEPRKVGA